MKTGVLYVVSTPIGNLEDITLRALRILGEVELIAAEDTRHTRKLLNHYQIRTKTTSLFDGNESGKSDRLVAEMTEGKSIALVSSAGTPLISDPGYGLVRRSIDANISIVPIPGVSAAIAAMSISGLPSHNFTFEGFLSAKPGKRQKQLARLSSETRTMIFYVSPHRLLKFLRDALEQLGDREICVARELTKKFEELFRGTISSAIEKFEAVAPRGEFTVLISATR